MRTGRLKKLIKELRRDLNKLLSDAKQVKSTFKPELNSSVERNKIYEEKRA